MTDPYVFIGGVDVSHACLRALCEMGRPPTLAIGYDSSRAQASGYRDLGPLCGEHGVELLRVAQVNDAEVVGRIRSLEPACMFVVGWSQLLKGPLLSVPRHGAVGIHPTPLPEGRGRAPIPWTILKRHTTTASTMFFLTEGVDDGDVVDRVDVTVDPREDAGTLYAKHRRAHEELVTGNIDALLEGVAAAAPQDESQATYWEARRPEDGRIDATRSVEDVDVLVRAVTRPFPGAFLESLAGRLVIWRAEPTPGSFPGEPGSIVERDGRPVLICGDGGLAILEAEGL